MTAQGSAQGPSHPEAISTCLVQSLVDGTSGLVGAGVVEGGTRRFVGASGGFDVSGAGEEITYDGWIVYDASNRLAVGNEVPFGAGPAAALPR